jgi:hypothetical protein
MRRCGNSRTGRGVNFAPHRTSFRRSDDLAAQPIGQHASDPENAVPAPLPPTYGPCIGRAGDRWSVAIRMRRGGASMASVEVSLKEMMAGVEGALGAAVVDYTSGMALGTLGGGKDLDLTVAAAGNTDVIRAKVRTMGELGLKSRIEDILITLEKQYHLIRLITGRSGNGLFLYLVLDKGRSNLAMARHQLKRVEEELEV